jgi:NADH dehydrogenase FAD-containing subunit
MSSSKTVVVLGCAYGGARAATQLASTLPPDWKVIVVDRNTHLNYVYVLPRVLVLPGHEGKAFVPYTNIFTHGNKSLGPVTAQTLMLHASVLSLTPHSVTLDKSFPEHGYEGGVIEFAYCVYALGSALSAPVNLWGSSLEEEEEKASSLASNEDEETSTEEETIETSPQPPRIDPAPYRGEKTQSLDWMKRTFSRIEKANTILVVGGGALGVQMSTDIAELYPGKSVTLLHSRDKLLNRFDDEVHTQALLTLDSLNVTTILGERLATWPDNSYKGTVRTNKGRELSADLILTCTGQTPNTHFLVDMDPKTVDKKSGMARVKRTMQLMRIPPSSSASASSASSAHSLDTITSTMSSLTLEQEQVALQPQEEEDEFVYENMFVVGDAADAFGAMKAGHTAYWQADVACKNIVRMIKSAERSSSSSAPSTPSAAVSSPAASSVSLDDEESDTEGESQRGGSEDGDTELEVELELEEDEFKLIEYTPGPPSIKVTLGVKHAVYQVNGEVGTKDDGQEDAGAAYIWPYFGLEVGSEEEYLL